MTTATSTFLQLQPTLPVYGYADAVYMRILYAMPNAAYMPVCLRVRATLTEVQLCCSIRFTDNPQHTGHHSLCNQQLSPECGHAH